jgi:hypothetical protein
MKTSRWSIVAPMLGPGLLLGLTLLLLTLPQAGLAQTSQANQSVGLSLGPAPKAGAWLIPHTVTSIANSSVTTGHCYEANQTQTLCFTVFNASTDAEWLNQVRLTFPPGPPVWTVNCSTQDATDSSGNPASLTCSEPLTNEVLFTDNDNASDGGLGEIMSGTGWGFCVNATVPVTYSGPRIINWGLSGDATSAIEGETLIEQCAPLMLKPASLTVEGCNGITQTHSFELWNNTGSGGSFDFVYDVPSGNATFAGPENFALVAGGTVTFNVQLTPDACLEPGQQVTATLQVAGQQRVLFGRMAGPHRQPCLDDGQRCRVGRARRRRFVVHRRLRFQRGRPALRPRNQHLEHPHARDGDFSHH